MELAIQVGINKISISETINRYELELTLSDVINGSEDNIYLDFDNICLLSDFLDRAKNKIIEEMR